MSNDRPKVSETFLPFFEFAHLPEHLQEPSRECAKLFAWACASLPEGPEKTAGIRKLLEAKDCFVRTRVTLPR